MSSSSLATIASWTYRDIGAPPPGSPPAEQSPEPVPQLAAPGISEAEANDRVQAALRDAKTAWDATATSQQQARDQHLATALQEFATQRSAYFRQIETEVVNLTLAIARKILKREATIDPTLLLGLTRIILDDLDGNGGIRVHVAPAELPTWMRSASALSSTSSVELIADSSLQPEDVVIETQAGRANVGFEAQLKQVEQGFLDLLAQRPE